MGLKGLCLYLKACSILVIKVVCEDPTDRNSTTYGINISLTRSKIPRILPRRFREDIRFRKWDSIRFILTILGLYRVLPFEGKLDTSTITEVTDASVPIEFEEWLGKFQGKFVRISLRDFFDPTLITSSGTMFHNLKGNKKYNSSAFWVQALMSLSIQRLIEPLRNIVACYPENSDSWSWIRLFDFITEPNGRKEIFDIRRVYNNFKHGNPKSSIGRLSLKIEPGKVRVFAIVDIVTQWALKPLHKGIFAFLKTLKTDATFDQNRGLKQFFQSLPKGRTVYSFDLSAATDRLPISIQRIILNWVIPGLGDNWFTVLSKRAYGLTDKRFRVDTAVRYGTGQPMGAYSSWAMLALTHHLILQYCAFMIKGKLKWFEEYCVLGDDIIIGDTEVALFYHKFMVETMKVKINLSKSVISPIGWGEFAKRITNGQIDISPLSLKEFSAWGKVSGSFVESLRKNPAIRLYDILVLMGKGSFSAGNQNSISRVMLPVLESLDPNVSIVEKLTKDIVGSPEEKESKLKYLLWSRLWDTHLEYDHFKRRLDQARNLKYNACLQAVHKFFGIVKPMQNIFSPIETSSFYEALILGISEKGMIAIEKDLAIRFKSYSEVSIEELLFILDLDLKDLIKPGLLLDQTTSSLSKIEGDASFKVNYDALDKVLKVRKDIQYLFPTINP